MTQLGLLGKLLSLSLWVWWPPGPRPREPALYPRRLALLEASTFAEGIEAVAVGVVAASTPVARIGASVLFASAVLTAAGAALTWQRRSRHRR